MTKSVLGLNLSAIAVLVFVLSYFAGIEVLVLILAYALLIEKDRWLNRQVFQAVYLKLAYLVAITVVGWVFDFLLWLFRYANAIYAIQNFVHFLLSVALILVILLAISRVIHGNEADLPFIGHFADLTLDATVKTPAAPTAPAAPVTPVMPAAPAAPVTPAAPFAPPAPPVPPAQPVDTAVPDASMAEVCEDDTVSAEFFESEPFDLSDTETTVSTTPPADPDNWVCADCGRENFGKFCMGCGKSRPA